MDNRTKILEVALDLFGQRGYDAVGVQEIAEGSGVTKPTLYHYYGSKKGLLEKLLDENFTPFIEELKIVSSYRGDMSKCLEDTAAAFFNFATANSVFYRLQLGMNFSSPDSDTFCAVLPYNNRIFSIIESMFITASRDHGNMRNRHKRYAATFIGMINNYITLHIGKHINLDARTVYDAVHQFSHGIYS